jgi:hypothetical protein
MKKYLLVILTFAFLFNSAHSQSKFKNKAFVGLSLTSLTMPKEPHYLEIKTMYKLVDNNFGIGFDFGINKSNNNKVLYQAPNTYSISKGSFYNIMFYKNWTFSRNFEIVLNINYLRSNFNVETIQETNNYKYSYTEKGYMVHTTPTLMYHFGKNFSASVGYRIPFVVGSQIEFGTPGSQLYYNIPKSFFPLKVMELDNLPKFFQVSFFYRIRKAIANTLE